ncbi:MAG: hypothetical protein DI570_04790 [Phenylobacterium zucineum]|nr:MAG: hypothetical protein DI570_04790 [Phenylobacterium zucineum]
MFDAGSLTRDTISFPGFNAVNYYADNALLKITINGKDHYVGSTYVNYSLVVADPPNVSSRLYALSVSSGTPDGYLEFQLASETQFMGANELATPFQYSPTDADLAEPLAANRRWGDIVFNTKDISFTPQAGGLPPIPTAGVPEPASWALMIVGFGGSGAMLRSRRLSKLG